MRTSRRSTTLAATAILAVALAACGGTAGDAADSNDDEIASLGTTATPAGPDATASGGTSPDAPQDPEEAMLSYTECMRDQGIDMPDPIANEGRGNGAFVVVEDTAGGDMEDFMAAEEECSPLLEGAMSEIENDPEHEAELREDMLEFAECMREQGIDMPDPVLNEDGGGMSVDVGSEDATPIEGGEPFEPDPEMQAAMQECGGADVMTETPDGGGD